MINLAVQTLWTKPQGFENIRRNTFFGFKTVEQFMASAYLSFEQLKQKGYQVHLYTDNYGKELLCDRLGLKYDYVDTCHQELDIPPNLWAFCKLYTHLKQKLPYIHIDLDAYVIKDFNDKIKKGNVVYQNLEVNNIFYKRIWSELKPHIKVQNRLSHMIRQLMDNEHHSYIAMNVGIFGGNNLRKIHAYSTEAVNFLNANLKHMPEENYFYFCTFIEQLYCYYYFYFHNVQTVALDNSLEKKIEDFVDWNNYTHLIADVKLFPDVVAEMVTLSKENGFKGV